MTKHAHVGLRMVALVLFGAMCACKNEPVLKPGDDLFGILDEVVLEVSLRSPTKLAKAQRSTTDRPFRYTFENGRGAKPTHCAASPQLNRAVALTYEVRIRGVLDASQAKAFRAAHESGWTTLEIRSPIVDAELFRLELFQDPKRPDLLYAKDPDDSRLFLVDSKLLRLLSLDCGA